MCQHTNLKQKRAKITGGLQSRRENSQNSAYSKSYPPQPQQYYNESKKINKTIRLC